VAKSPLRRQNPRGEPGALAAHAGICAHDPEKIGRRDAGNNDGGVARRRSLIALTMLCGDPLAIAMTAAASAAGKPGCPRWLYLKIAAGSFSASLSRRPSRWGRLRLWLARPLPLPSLAQTLFEIFNNGGPQAVAMRRRVAR
jgi:hypothetical protein